MKALVVGLAAFLQVAVALPGRAFTVSPFSSAAELAGALLVPGWAPIATSISVTEASPGAIGFFNDALSPIGFSSGVLLTTGSITNALGPNLTGSASGPGQTSVISFDFTAVSPGIRWNYVFASEEYEEYVGSVFNDQFSLSLDGVNLALIPGSLNPVAINSVNQYTNSSYYRSNTNGSLDVGYDGLTTVLTASAQDLIPGQTYNVNFTITDVGDSAWDSGVFIQAESVAFDGATPQVPLIPVAPPSPVGTWEFPQFSAFDPNFTFWLDPDVATGYVYSVVDPSGPLFDSFVAPVLPFDDTYELFASNDSCVTFEESMGVIKGDVSTGFTPTPCFAVKGIDVANMLDPTDVAAFVAGVSFNTTGLVSVTQTPITQFVPEPSTAVPGPLPLLGMGAAFGWSRQLRRRLAQSGEACQR